MTGVGAPRLVAVEPPAHRPVLGRDREFAQAESFVDSVGQRFGILLVEGEAGIGKTTVWREVVRRAEDRGVLVLAARPAEAETTLAASALADVLERVPDSAVDALPGPQRRAFDVAMLRVEPSGAPLDARTLGAAVRSLLAELSAAGPLIVAIDDVQWVDPTSAAALAFALRRLSDQPVGCLLAHPWAQPPQLVRDVATPEALARLTLGPLSLAAMHHVLKSHLDQSLSRATLGRVHEACGGNPLHALEVAHAMRDAGPSDASDGFPVPESLREAVAARVATLEPDARDALLAAAALARPTVELVERASSVAGLGAAEETQLLTVREGRIAFAHPLYASAVCAMAATSRRRRLHQRLARLVSDPEERAHHLAAAASTPDETVARALEDGAAIARARGAWAPAAELLERARALTPVGRPDDADRRAILAAEYHLHAGEPARAREIVGTVPLTVVPPPLRADAKRLQATISLHDQDLDQARRLFGEALAEASDPGTAGPIQLGLGYVHAAQLDFDGAHGYARGALDCAAQAQDGEVAARALLHATVMDVLSGRDVDCPDVKHTLERNADECRLVPLARDPATLAALRSLCAGRYSEARTALRTLCTNARERGDESDLAFALAWWSWLETLAGDVGAAATLATEATSTAALGGSRTRHALTLAQQAYVMAHIGDVEETERCRAEAVSRVEPFRCPLVDLWAAAASGLLEVSRGNAEAAWEAYEPMTVPIETTGIGAPLHAFFLPDAVEALIGIGQLDRAERLLDAMETPARAVERSWAFVGCARCRALLLCARSDLKGGSAAVDRAVADYERLDVPFELARTLLVKGAIERRTRKRALAKESFERALGIFDEAGARLWADRARSELDRVGLRRATGELTEGEQRVAVLAGQGLTNRAVAAALFLSPKTVEANLARIYRKLGITSRAELGARMADVVPTSA